MLKFSKETFFNKQNFVKENREYIGIYWHKVIAPCRSWVTHESFQFMQSSVGQLRGRLGKSSSNNGLHNIFLIKYNILVWANKFA
jgi:hypothetical protein